MERATSKMTVDTKLPESPRQLIYAQLDRLLLARAEGKGGAETLSGIMSLIVPYKDEDWYDDMRQMASLAESHPNDERVLLWHIVEAIIRLLDRNNLWVNVPRAVEPGEELTQAV